MTHFVIPAAGIAGVTAAYSLISKFGPNDEVTVVSDKGRSSGGDQRFFIL